MRRLGPAIGLVSALSFFASAGSLEVKPLGKPFRVQQMNAAPVTVQNVHLPTERIWQMVQDPTIDVVTGQVLAEGSRASTVIFDNTVNDTGYFTILPVADQFGDEPRMTNGGTLKSISLSIFNGDATNKLFSAKVKVLFYRPSGVPFGSGLPPVLIGSFTSPTINFVTNDPEGMPFGSGLVLTLDTSALSPPIVLPQVVYVGAILMDIAGDPAPIRTWGQALFSPPVIGTDFSWFWGYTLDGTGVFKGDYGFSNNSPPGDLYYKIEVDPLAYTPPPIYSNVTNATGYAFTDAPNATVSDDLACVPFPAGEVLDRIDFSIFNGSTATLNTVDLDIVLRNWNPASGDYFAEAQATSWVLSLTGATVDLPPSYGGGFYVSGLATQASIILGNGAAYCDVLAGVRFYNMRPVTVTKVGQLLYNPPTVGGSDSHYFWDFPGSGEPAIMNFYWRLETASPLPCALKGDMNCDGVVNGQDIDGVIAALFNPDQYAMDYPACNILCGDMNGDGVVNGQDIDGFVAALFGE